MPNRDAELLAAERAGRVLVSRLAPKPGDDILLRPSGADGPALMTAARLAARFGASVRVRLPRTAEPDPISTLLAESTRRQGLLDDFGGVDTGDAVIVNGVPQPYRAPDPARAWAEPLSVSAPFVREADASAPRMSCAQCREVDARAIREFGVPGLCLMENAAVDAVIVAMDMVREFDPEGCVLVAVGGGNNGGDGLAAARGLWELGVGVDVALLKDPAGIAGDAAVNLRILREDTGVAIHDIHERPKDIGDFLKRRVLAVDALLGTGFRGGLSPGFARAIAALNASGRPILSLDIPSGLDGDDGSVSEIAVKAARTVTFAAVKTGLATGRGPEHCGTLYLGDIGAPTAALDGN